MTKAGGGKPLDRLLSELVSPFDIPQSCIDERYGKDGSGS